VGGFKDSNNESIKNRLMNIVLIGVMQHPKEKFMGSDNSWSELQVDFFL